ncbi:hypothetical protein F2Q69_00054764 [Brassica cretica]|uniref:Uncharacterized protein n=1 Tax=Brassica cretica TaxID=69181 RepID=A0A8S9NBD3_BRACR|nr:hypothetical protein F2Q69_00054764 [Brassica cretica]
MVASIVLIEDATANLNDQEGRLRNPAGFQNQRSGNQSGYRNSFGNGQRSGYNQSSQYQKLFSNDDFWQLVKEEKLQEGDFQVKSSMSFSDLHWFRPTPRNEHLPMETDEDRSISATPHRSPEEVRHVQ